jgi:hypothetical protein
MEYRINWEIYIPYAGTKIKDTIDTDRSASFLVLHLEIDSEGRLRMKFCHKRDDFNFPIVNLPFICSNIPAVPHTNKGTSRREEKQCVPIDMPTVHQI